MEAPRLEKLLYKYFGEESRIRSYENVEAGVKADNFLLIVGESIIFGANK
jgi:hypothetical protein